MSCPGVPAGCGPHVQGEPVLGPERPLTQRKRRMNHVRLAKNNCSSCGES